MMLKDSILIVMFAHVQGVPKKRTFRTEAASSAALAPGSRGESKTGSSLGSESAFFWDTLYDWSLHFY